ncbi:Tripartite-type tricarboxylate transporter, receptor component TctC [Variovorax sp. HW608]|uniref:Bug family tripartite tricarboxylate transporter substrate binding protein n=1 Tax=Variovorax sp. HW608 TaxID=1034889 RepID=UPI00081FA193|nr:Bug family tripartite tricarboxylate transporter substrate binding protein [Variovorax sp. HW608]SCK15478.1 Tripartite-type tricarboxylate transporter, receptor component TctC [Variovorax sp. HW608]
MSIKSSWENSLPTSFSMQRRLFLQAAAAAAAIPAASAFGQGAQLEVAKFITGFAAGGTSDTLCRRLAARMTGSYAKTVVVDNRTGAGGQIAIQVIKTLPADGSAILQTPMSMLGIYPHIYKKLPYDPLKDLAPVSLGCVFDFGFAVGPAVPNSVNTVPEFLAWVKSSKNNSFGSPAAGSVPHFIGVLLGRSAGVDMTHVPYRGTQTAILDLIGGQIPAVSGPVGDFLPHLAAGKCRLLATSGSTRNRFAPTVATFMEQGLKDMAFSEWFGLFLPAGASREVVQRANAALRPALASPEIVEGLGVMGLQAASSTPEELAGRLKADYERWGPIVKSIGFTAES